MLFNQSLYCWPVWTLNSWYLQNWQWILCKMEGEQVHSRGVKSTQILFYQLFLYPGVLWIRFLYVLSRSFFLLVRKGGNILYSIIWYILIGQRLKFQQKICITLITLRAWPKSRHSYCPWSHVVLELNWTKVTMTLTLKGFNICIIAFGEKNFCYRF